MNTYKKYIVDTIINLVQETVTLHDCAEHFARIALQPEATPYRAAAALQLANWYYTDARDYDATINILLYTTP